MLPLCSLSGVTISSKLGTDDSFSKSSTLRVVDAFSCHVSVYALIIGFNVRPDANARKAAEAEKVDVRTYRVIYDALNDVEAAIKGMLAPKFEEVIQGRVEVRQLITISKLLIAGCYVTEGKVTNHSKVRVIRDGIVVHEGEIESLRRFKDDVKEVNQGYECGITLEKFRDLKEGDQFEIFNMEEVKID